jgi:hypothetical protein
MLGSECRPPWEYLQIKNGTARQAAGRNGHPAVRCATAHKTKFPDCGGRGELNPAQTIRENKFRSIVRWRVWGLSGLYFSGKTCTRGFCKKNPRAKGTVLPCAKTVLCNNSSVPIQDVSLILKNAGLGEQKNTRTNANGEFVCPR